MNNDPVKRKFSRRAFLIFSAQVAATAGLTKAAPVFAAQIPHSSLSFYHTHTGETLMVNLKSYTSQTVRKLNRFLRDFRTGETHPIDPHLLDILDRIRKLSGSKGTYEVISGYRSPATNEMLRHNSNGVAKKSLHMQGRAIDIRLTDLSTCDLRDVACSLRKGGVGYYPKSDFVHIDTGRVRTW